MPEIDPPMDELPDLPGGLFGEPASDDERLAEAVIEGKLDEVRRLLDAGADPNANRKFLGPPLSICASGPAHAPIDRMLRRPGRIPGFPPPGSSPEEGLKAMSKLLQSHTPQQMQGNRRRARDKARRSADLGRKRPPDETRHLEVAKLLLERGANVAARGEIEGQTALHDAARSGCARMTALLLDHGADIEAEDKSGKTPLMLATEECKIHVVRVLLERGADAIRRGTDGHAPMHSAALGGSKRILAMLIERGADVNAATDAGTTPLLIAQMRQYPDIVKLLERAGARVGYLEAVVRDDSALADELERGLPTDRHPSWGSPVLEWGIRQGRVDILKRVLGVGVSANGLTSNKNSTPLMLAAMHGSPDVVRALLEAGADPNATRARGFMPLTWAARRGDSDTAQLLLQHGADPNTPGCNVGGALQGAASSGSIEIVRMLLDAGASPVREHDGLSPAVSTLMMGHHEILKLLFEHGADPRTACHGKVPIDVLPRALGDARMKAIIQEAAGTDLHEAAAAGDVERLRSLLAAGRTPEARDTKGRTALIAAVEAEQRSAAEFLLDHGADVNGRSEHGRTPLSVAVRGNQIAIAKLLLDRGADPDLPDQTCQTPLVTAALSMVDGRREFVDLLRSRGGVVGIVEAAALGDTDEVLRMIDAGTPADTRVPTGPSALCAAAATGNDALVAALLDRGADINLQIWWGQCALSQASGRGHLSTVALLLDRGANPNVEAKSCSMTPLGSAVVTGQADIVRLLVQRGARIDMADTMGHTIAHEAAMSKEGVAMVGLLAELGAKMSGHTKAGLTPLMMAAMLNRVDVVRAFVEHGADPNVRDRTGSTALTHAERMARGPEAAAYLRKVTKKSK